MIALKYAKQILNALFHTGGSAGKSAEEEMEEFKSQGAVTYQYKDANGNVENVFGVSAGMYMLAFDNDGYIQNGETSRRYNAIKTAVSKSNWYKVVQTRAEFHEYTEDGDKKSVAITGWYIVKNSEQRAKYPSNTYLALFTRMPDENGDNYLEPTNGADGNLTTYMRTNIHCAVITGNECLNHAEKDESTGASTIANREMIMFPRISESNWGKIIGFGIFQEEGAGVGSPVLWGRLKNENGIDTEVDHVPLFRIGDFKVTLQ